MDCRTGQRIKITDYRTGPGRVISERSDSRTGTRRDKTGPQNWTKRSKNGPKNWKDRTKELKVNGQETRPRRETKV